MHSRLVYALAHMGAIDAHDSFPRSFFILTFTLCGLLLASVIIINLTAEHVSDEQVTDRSVNNAQLPVGMSERATKFALLDTQTDVDFVLVGNSRVQRWDPRVITATTGARGFNAGVVGDTLGDFRALIEWTGKRAVQRHEPGPHFVIVTPIEVFGSEVDADTSDIPGVSSDQHRALHLQGKLERFKRLTQWQSLKQSLKILAHESSNPSTNSRRNKRTGRKLESGSPVLQGDGVISPAPGVSTHAPSQAFRSDGYLRSGAFLGAEALSGASNGLTGFVDQQIIGFYQQLRESGGLRQVTPAARDMFEKMITAANDVGDTPTIVIPPIDEAAVKRFDSLGRTTFANTVIEWLTSESNTHNFVVLDYSDANAFAPYESSFYDGQHPKPDLARALVSRLVHDDVRLHSPH